MFFKLRMFVGEVQGLLRRASPPACHRLSPGNVFEQQRQKLSPFEAVQKRLYFLPV
jgi:hypothetical protein